MNRPRKNGKHLPRRMIESHGSYFLLKPIGFRRNKAIRLGRVRGVEGKTEDELYAQALKRYADLIAEVDAPVGTMVKLLERWKNEALSKYALKTRKEYIRMTDIASKAFAEFDIEHVRPMHIAAFVDDNFIDKPNAANKYKALLSLVFSFAVRKGLRDDNPCRDIHGVPEPKRQRYITDEELARVRAAALWGNDDKPTPSGRMIVCLIDLAVVTGQRIGDLLALKWSDVSEEGVLFKPRKTAKSTGVIVPVKMTSQLQNILERARHFGNVKGITVIHTIKGHPYTYFGAQTAWKRAVARACTRYEEECKKRDMTLDTAFLRNMHFHDLRRKSLTDAKRQGKDPQKLAGHTDPKMTARYLENVEIEWVEPVQIAQIG
ncbi:Phage integrase family protein [Candidatus Glomeribacter gigasporarum BEG34]|uniref:Phage integrase family protein n=1 Tax=Candidatus Glomeribacter gigasporarum BEG34 TaxID=1070319 RepID=G2J7W2_9BURK|nr:Phage integrase family protein [Candidatus Glomeribacter gigasporarum BEG34]